MKKLLLIFLLVCSGIIYTLESGCKKKDEAPAPNAYENTGCGGAPLPTCSIEASETETYTGNGIWFEAKGLSADVIKCEWTFLGSAKGDQPIIGNSTGRYWSSPGEYPVKLRVFNGCWWTTKHSTITVIALPRSKDGKSQTSEKVKIDKEKQ